jgi:hypothetical protein
LGITFCRLFFLNNNDSLIGASQLADLYFILYYLHKVRIFKEYHSVCPLVGIATIPTPLSPASVPSPQHGGGAHSPAGEGLGDSQYRRLEKKLSTLPALLLFMYIMVCVFHRN